MKNMRSKQPHSAVADVLVGAVAFVVVGLITFFSVRSPTSAVLATPRQQVAVPLNVAVPPQDVVAPQRQAARQRVIAPQDAAVPRSVAEPQIVAEPERVAEPRPQAAALAAPSSVAPIEPPVDSAEPTRPSRTASEPDESTGAGSRNLDRLIGYSPTPLLNTSPLYTEEEATPPKDLLAMPPPTVRPHLSMPAKPSGRGSEPAPRAPAETFVGVWARAAAECRERTGDDMRIRIDARGAETLGVRCDFRSVRQEGASHWRVRARCSAEDKSGWTANIKLAMVGSKLRWSSERGTETYLRCRR
jgi:hypothetical protein